MGFSGQGYAWYKLLVSKLVTRYWWIVIVAWIALAIGLRTIAPAWKDVAADGDLAFLPSTVPSAIGQRALEDAFPGSNTRSQMVLVIANPDAALATEDVAYAFDIARHLHWWAAESAWKELKLANDPTASTATAIRSNSQSVSPSPPNPTDEVSDQPAISEEQSELHNSALIDVVKDNLTDAIEIEIALSKFYEAREIGASFRRLPTAYQIRGELYQMLGEQEAAAIDLDTAKLMREQSTPVLSSELPVWFSAVRDVWSWKNNVIGHKLQSNDKRAKLIAVELGTEFTAVENIDIINGMETLVRDLRGEYTGFLSKGLKVEVTGSAAIGADMLRAAASGVKQTEIVTIVLVLLILAVVYRAPFLVAIPLASIALSLVVATSVIALLARDPAVPGSLGLGVFTTTRIFIVVLLFGAGTDFCLFLLARCRELLQASGVETRQQMHLIVAKGWRSVHDALVASALTTIVGLALMWFSRFEKFQFSGPIIAISLAITLLVCLSFTPSMLCGLGQLAFWPQLRTKTQAANLLEATTEKQRTSYWSRLADKIVARPGLALAVTLLALAIPAGYGVSCLGYVTYDLTEELSANAPSRRGSSLVSRFFTTTDSSPVTILLTRETPFESEEELREACDQLAASLYIDGVDSVRSLSDPLGDYPPGKRMGLFDKDAWRRRLLQGHRITRVRYISSIEAMSRRVAKFDVILRDNPFSLEAAATLARLQEKLAVDIQQTQSAWHGTEFTSSGTTVGITDLRHITQADQRRIQILVTIGVWLVLVIMLRQLVLTTYLIFTVLLSYFATLGITYYTFSQLYADYTGLDWKVPLFLFVILIAVGQDYNVYLVTRIFEERKKLGLRDGVHRALTMTGGIITSCGLVMAGTFVAMTSPAITQWLSEILPVGWISNEAPVLRGITELGFALAFGVLLDTLVVRSILVPAFALLWQPETWNRQKKLR